MYVIESGKSEDVKSVLAFRILEYIGGYIVDMDHIKANPGILFNTVMAGLNSKHITVFFIFFLMVDKGCCCWCFG